MISYYFSDATNPAITTKDSIHLNGWIRAERPSDDEQDLLAGLGIDSDLLTDALDPHEVPRIEYDDGWTYLITRVPDVGDDFNDFTTPVMFAIGTTQVVTVSRDPLGRLWQPFIDASATPTSERTRFLIEAIEMIIRSYQTRVATINRQMRAATSDIRTLRPSDIAIFVEYERKLNDYLDALIPTNTAVEKSLSGRMLKLQEADKDLVEDLSVDLEQVIARCKSLLRTITNVRDSYRAVMDTRLNETMRILTVATLALTIPTMLAGVFGMNVDFPFDARAPLVFWMIVFISVTCSSMVVYYFVRKR